MLLVGAFGLRILIGQPLPNCFYQAVMLLTTVGSREPLLLTRANKMFVVIFLAGVPGVSTFSTLQFRQILVTVNQLPDHFVICG